MRKLNIDIVRANSIRDEKFCLKRIIETEKIDLILDVGANVGQFAEMMRKDIGYQGKIVSFEPLSSAFQILSRRASRDKLWQVNRLALGDKNEEVQIHVSQNSYSSSILGMLSSHLKAAPESRYISSESVSVRKLDDIFSEHCNKGSRIMLKIDTQGYEDKVLNGVKESLKYIDLIKLEMSVIPLYEGQMLYLDMDRFLTSLGYRLIGIERGFTDRNTGEMLQYDGLYKRVSAGTPV